MAYRHFLLDTANLADIEYGVAHWPVAGVTTNPGILKREGRVKVFEHLAAIQKLLGPERTLHAQTIAADAAGMCAEGRELVKRLGRDVFVKIPVTEQGLSAIKTLHDEGVRVTATGIYTSLQGVMAAMAGADFLCVYYSRILREERDAEQVLRELDEFLRRGGFDTCEIVAASFKAPEQVTDALYAGAQRVTVAPGILRDALGAENINGAVTAFKQDFESLYGAGATLLGQE